MRVLSAQDVRQAVPMAAAIDAVATAFVQLSAGQATVPLRTRIELAEHEATSFFMPAHLSGEQGRLAPALGLKVVSVFPHNMPRHGVPSIHALVVLLDPATGRPLAALEGAYLTALRTGAASGAATRAMARPDARVLALFGAGVQARSQVQAVCAVRPIERIWVVNRTRENAMLLSGYLRADGIKAEVRLAPSAAAALAEADVVCCATGATTPLFADADLRPGTHINAIGSHHPQATELPLETVARSYLVVDQRAAAWAEAGELAQAQAAGLIDERHVVAELGEVLSGQVLGRPDAAAITCFKSVGNAVQDLAVAQIALEQALAQNLGVEVPLG